jgi:hypothetical protein
MCYYNVNYIINVKNEIFKYNLCRDNITFKKLLWILRVFWTLFGGLQMKYRSELLVLFFLGLLSLSMVIAAPTGPSSITPGASTRYSSPGAANASAIAGNVTELNFIANTITNTWQGYFGNVSGIIVLGNSNNQSMYNWNLSSPTGQIYATRGSLPTWTSIRCANQTEIDDEDAALGVNQTTDQDSVNKTFLNTTLFDPFYVGSQNINTAQDCRAVQLFDENGVATSAFSEVLLSDTADMIYTGLITAPTTGFDNNLHQFQMLVGENGHLGNTAETTYFFYLELN